MPNTWQALTNDSIIDAVQKVIEKPLSGLVLKRNSYINRVFELEEEDSKQRLIVKFYRLGRWKKEQILEEHAFVKVLFNNDNHVIPPLEYGGRTLFEANGIHFAVFPKKGGRALDEFDKEGWENIGQLVGKMHLAGTSSAGSKRVVWTPEKATSHHVKVLHDLKVIPEDYKTSFDSSVENLLKRSKNQFNGAKLIRLHGDIHRGNFIHRPGEGTYVVDFDDMCVGPSVQDMWMLLPDEADKCLSEVNWFAGGYEMFSPFKWEELSLIPYLRAMRMVHFAAWCAVQKNDPGFEDNFPEWGTPKYWGQLVRDVNELMESSET